MPKISLVDSLPIEVRENLNQKLIEKNFSCYEELSEWLNEQGFEISKSSIHRHGVKFQKNLAAIKSIMEQAKAITDSVDDDENALGEALCRLAQQKTFEALIDLEESNDVSLPQLTRAIADLNRSSVTIKKYKAEIKNKVKQQISEENLKDKENLSKLDAKTLDLIRKEIYGIL